MQPENNPPAAPVLDPDAAPLMEHNEVPLALVRRHWFGLAGIIVTCFVALVAMLVFTIALGTSSSTQISNNTFGMIVAVGVLVMAVILFMLLLITYIYRQSTLTISDRSLVQVIQRGLFNKKVSRLSMSNVEDVNVEQNGLLCTMFNFGTLTVETAGEEDNFVFGLCPNPNHYASLILDARQAYARHPNE